MAARVTRRDFLNGMASSAGALLPHSGAHLITDVFQLLRVAHGTLGLLSVRAMLSNHSRCLETPQSSPLSADA
jgi:hypothetical protein